MRNLTQKFHSFLHHPFKVLVTCISFAVLSLLMNGGFFQLYRLHRDTDLLNSQIQATHLQIKLLDEQMQQAKDPHFIERQAVDRYELAEEHDLVFVFPDE